MKLQVDIVFTFFADMMSGKMRGKRLEDYFLSVGKSLVEQGFELFKHQDRELLSESVSIIFEESNRAHSKDFADQLLGFLLALDGQFGKEDKTSGKRAGAQLIQCVEVRSLTQQQKRYF